MAEEWREKELAVPILATENVDDDFQQSGNSDEQHVRVQQREGKKSYRKKKEVKLQKILYNVNQSPPIPVVCGFAVQMAIKMLPPLVFLNSLIATAVCASPEITVKLFNTMGVMVGLTSFIQATFGIRLPVLQGPSIYHVLAMVNRYDGELDKCPIGLPFEQNVSRGFPLNRSDAILVANSSQNANGTLSDGDSLAEFRLQQAVLPLIAASVIHMILAFSGAIGYLTRFVGPATIVPPQLLLSFDVVPIVTGFASTHWGITFLTLMIVFVFSSYLGHISVPIPSWSRQRGFHVSTRLKLLRLFGAGMGLSFGWILCLILTETNVLSDNPDHKEYLARTDRTVENVASAKWFYFPYPGQFGPSRFDVGLLVGFTVAVFVSVLDSVADYMIFSEFCEAPIPPPHAVNRGLFVEGSFSLLTGAFGGAHATTSYAGFVGDMLLTGACSRRLVQATSVLLTAIALLGKVAALLVSLPKPVLGGLSIVTCGVFVGNVLSCLDNLDMRKPRNVVAIGVPIFGGLLLTGYVKKNPSCLDVGIPSVTETLVVTLGNSMLVSGFLGCFLDNTLPGKDKVYESELYDKKAPPKSLDMTVYDLPRVTDWLRRRRWSRYIPILPNFGK